MLCRARMLCPIVPIYISSGLSLPLTYGSFTNHNPQIKSNFIYFITYNIILIFIITYSVLETKTNYRIMISFGFQNHYLIMMVL